MKLTVGDKVVYPSQGPCLIGSIAVRIIDGRPLSFYQLIILSDHGGDLFVPVDKVEAIGIRVLLAKTEIPGLLDQLKKRAEPSINSRDRNFKNIKLFASGSAVDLAEIVESLTELKETKALSFGECKRLERARSLLVCEISEVMEETKEEAEQQVDDALRARNEQVNPDPVANETLTGVYNQNRPRKGIAALKNRKTQWARAQGA